MRIFVGESWLPTEEWWLRDYGNTPHTGLPISQEHIFGETSIRHRWILVFWTSSILEKLSTITDAIAYFHYMTKGYARRNGCAFVLVPNLNHIQESDRCHGPLLSCHTHHNDLLTSGICYSWIYMFLAYHHRFPEIIEEISLNGIFKRCNVCRTPNDNSI